MGDLEGARDYRQAQEMKRAGSEDEAIKHMHETAEHRLAQMLLARFLLLKLLVTETQAVNNSLPTDAHRRLWVLLQAQPSVVFDRGFESDVFTQLSRLLRETSIYDLKGRIRAMYQELSPLLQKVHNPAINTKDTPPFFCVVDESQTAARLRSGEFTSDDGRRDRPLLKEIYQTWTSVLPPVHMRLILSGTGIDVRLFKETLNSPAFKEQKYRVISDIGAFDDIKSQKEYIMQYVLANWSEPRWDAFLRRAWVWLRGRCLILLIAHRLC